MLMKLISYSATAPGASGAAAAAATGDSLTIENGNKPAKLLAWWTKNQAAGFHRITSPSGHDTSRGFSVLAPAGVGVHDLPLVEFQPQELLSITVAGSATAGDVEAGCLLLFYPDMPGVAAKLITAAELDRRMKQLHTVQCTVASTAGIYGVEELVTAENDALKATTDYAVLGITGSLTTLGATLRGPDFGNVRVGCPPPSPLSETKLTDSFFYRLSQRTGLATIPVFNSGNKASTYIGQSTDENAAASVLTLQLARL